MKNILEILMLFGYIAAACCSENIPLCAGLIGISFLSGFIYKMLWCRGIKK
ncbi:MAG: hypothetical protein IJ306_01030 [Oscillospiraceae bacterium]|nr:hypothetical protein [Oscillospiraceae bacterium]